METQEGKKGFPTDLLMKKSCRKKQNLLILHIPLGRHLVQSQAQQESHA